MDAPLLASGSATTRDSAHPGSSHTDDDNQNTDESTSCCNQFIKRRRGQRTHDENVNVLLDWFTEEDARKAEHTRTQSIETVRHFILYQID
jgi:hypothetical protein